MVNNILSVDYINRKYPIAYSSILISQYFSYIFRVLELFCFTFLFCFVYTPNIYCNMDTVFRCFDRFLAFDFLIYDLPGLVHFVFCVTIILLFNSYLRYRFLGNGTSLLLWRKLPIVSIFPFFMANCTKNYSFRFQSRHKGTSNSTSDTTFPNKINTQSCKIPTINANNNINVNYEIHKCNAKRGCHLCDVLITDKLYRQL